MLVGAVVVGAVGDGGREAEGAGPGAHQQVGGRLGGAVRGARAGGRLVGEAGRVVQRQVAVDLVGGDVVVVRAVLAAGVGLGPEAVAQVGVADVAHDELDAVGGQPGDVVGVAGVGQLVEYGDVHLR